MNKFLVLFSASCLLPGLAAPSFGRDPQTILKESDRIYHSGDTEAALKSLKDIFESPRVEEWMLVEAVKQFAQYYRAPSDSESARIFFTKVLNASGSQSAISTLLALLMDYPALTGEEKLSVLSGLNLQAKPQEEILETQIRLLRRLGRHAPAVDFAGRLAGLTGKLEHRVLLVDLLLDLSRAADASALAGDILRDFAADVAAYSELAERFYRHGDYRSALDIHRRARAAFSNPGLFFDQSLSICQGLQLGREGIELYLPALWGGAVPAPEYFKDFISMVTDTVFLTQTYPSWISNAQNPNLFQAALFRFAEIASDTACLEFARLYVQKFQEWNAHLGLAEQLLQRSRLGIFQKILNDVSDTPLVSAESKKLMLFRYVLKTAGPGQALEQHPPASFTLAVFKASAHRLASEEFLRAGRISDAISELLEAQKFSVDPGDDLRMARLYFLSGSDSEALKAAHRAHAAAPSEESLYWLGWLSYLESDTETARTALRDVVLKSENFLADESLTWLIAMAKPNAANPGSVGDAMRAATSGRRLPGGETGFPIAVRVALWTEALKSGLSAKSAQAEGSPYLQFLRWEALKSGDRTENQYQQLLMGSPEHLRPLIRTEEP